MNLSLRKIEYGGLCELVVIIVCEMEVLLVIFHGGQSFWSWSRFSLVCVDVSTNRSSLSLRPTFLVALSHYCVRHQIQEFHHSDSAASYQESHIASDITWEKCSWRKYAQ